MDLSRLTAARSLVGVALVALIGGVALTGGPSARADAGQSVTYSSGWNLVSLPPNTSLSDVSGPLYTLQPNDTDYETVQPAQGTQSGFGYWLYAGASTKITLDAGSTDLYAVLAPAGQYVMIGNPSGTQSAAVSGADIVYTYDLTNGYVQATALNPGQGAWALSNSGGPIQVQPGAAPIVVAPPPTGAQPPSARFYGSVTVKGQPASSGTSVTAKSSGGATCGSTTVGAAPATGSNYALDLTGSDSGCSQPGSTLTFTVGSAAANTSGQAKVPDVSGAVKADLTVP